MTSASHRPFQRRAASPPESSSRARRRALLDAAGLAWAPRETQQAFWRKHNFRRGRAAVPIGDVARTIIGARSIANAALLTAVRRAWDELAPAGLREHCEPIAVRAGRVTIAVDNPSIKFVLQREVGPALLAALRQELDAPLRELVYELGSVRGDDFDAAPRESGE